MSPPVFPVNGSLSVAPPFPPSGPGEPGSPTSRVLDFTSTMRALRLPARAFPVPYGFGSRLHMLPRVRDRRSAPGVAEDRVRAWALWSAGLPRSGNLHVDTHGISQVSWRSIPYLCPALRPRPDRTEPRHLRFHRCCPRAQHAEGSSTNMISGLNPGALISAAYASRAALPPPMQGSLPAGGLRLCREGVEPSGTR